MNMVKKVKLLRVAKGAVTDRVKFIAEIFEFAA